MKRKGVTLIELIVVLALIGIILPLTYGIYLNGIKLSNFISDNVNVQTDGSLAINEINSDLRLAKFTSNNFIKDLDGNYQVKYLNRNFYAVDTTQINANGYFPIYYMESLTNSKSFIYVSTKRIDVNGNILDINGNIVDGYYDVYKLFLTLIPNTTDDTTGRTVLIHNLYPSSFKIIDDTHIPVELGIASSSSYMDDFENLVFNTNSIYKGRNEIKFNADTSDDPDVDPNFKDPLINDHLIVLGCFNYSGLDYVYFMHDVTGVKYYAELGNKAPFPADYYQYDNKKLILQNVKDFTITHSGITFNIQFDKKLSNANSYHFNVDVNPIYLGGGD